MTTTCVLTGAWQNGIPYPAVDGQRVVYSAPGGTALCRQYGGAGEWSVVTTPSGFTHTGGPAEYKVVGALTPQTVALDIY